MRCVEKNWHDTADFTIFMFASGTHPAFPLPLQAYGARGGVVVEALRFKPESRGFDSPMVSLDFFHWHNPSGRTMALG
jgi:hypothetical protein